MDPSDLPNVTADALHPIDFDALEASADSGHPPRILLLYGSLRSVSYSRLCAMEAARILRAFGCETRMFDPSGLPFPDDADEKHDKVVELCELVAWCDGMVWSSPERHGSMTGIMKTQVDWMPLGPIGGIRLTQGKTLAVMQVSGGAQSFNTVNQLRILGRWMRMITIPNQSSVPKVWGEFENGRMKPGPLYNRIVDVMEELVRFTLLTRGRPQMTDRYSERVARLEAVSARVNKAD